MRKWEVVKNLNLKQTGALFVWFLKHPIFMYATLNATLKTLRVAQKEFPKIHGLHNKANAFRHAFWNLIIAKECCKFSSDIDKVLTWTRTITDWHEEFSPNPIMAKLMDLHNNALGRKLFLEYKALSKKQIILHLKKELSKAVLVRSKTEFEVLKNRLVYLQGDA
jgi:hypothetical protein